MSTGDEQRVFSGRGDIGHAEHETHSVFSSQTGPGRTRCCSYAVYLDKFEDEAFHIFIRVYSYLSMVYCGVFIIGE